MSPNVAAADARFDRVGRVPEIRLRSCPVKVTFAMEEAATAALCSPSSHCLHAYYSGVSVRSDRTPAQYEAFKVVRAELAAHAAKGERDIRIAVRGGTPCIISGSGRAAALGDGNSGVPESTPRKKTSLGESLAKSRAYNPIRDPGETLSER